MGWRVPPWGHVLWIAVCRNVGKWHKNGKILFVGIPMLWTHRLDAGGGWLLGWW